MSGVFSMGSTGIEIAPMSAMKIEMTRARTGRYMKMRLNMTQDPAEADAVLGDTGSPGRARCNPLIM